MNIDDKRTSVIRCRQCRPITHSYTLYLSVAARGTYANLTRGRIVAEWVRDMPMVPAFGPERTLRHTQACGNRPATAGLEPVRFVAASATNVEHRSMLFDIESISFQC